jgi:1-phosphatidylinositol-3-phosphate 5-kinase
VDGRTAVQADIADAKRILLDSLTTDTRFLSCQSIIDYSLLLGLDHKRSELVVGLVDAVGSYGLFKNPESIGKVALNRGREGEVTIVSLFREIREGIELTGSDPT